MSDFDHHDDELGAALRSRAASSSVHVTTAHDAVLHRASTIRRRRAAAGGGGLAVLALAGALLLPRGGDTIDTAGTVDSVDDTVDSTPATAPATADTTDPLPTVVDLTVPDDTTVDDSTPTTDTNPTTSATPTTADETTTTLDGTTTTTGETTTTIDDDTTTTVDETTTTVGDDAGPAPFTRTYSSSGGSITVTWNGTALSLDAVTPAADHDAEIEDQGADRVRVRFNGPSESRIEIRVEGGEVRERID